MRELTEQAVLLERSHCNLAAGPFLAGINPFLFLREDWHAQVKLGHVEKSLQCKQPALHQPWCWENDSGGAEHGAGLPVTRAGRVPMPPALWSGQGGMNTCFVHGMMPGSSVRRF